MMNYIVNNFVYKLKKRKLFRKCMHSKIVKNIKRLMRDLMIINIIFQIT